MSTSDGCNLMDSNADALDMKFVQQLSATACILSSTT